LTARQKAKAVASALLAKKGLDVCVLDLGEMNSFTDFLVLATGTSERHARALAEAAEHCARERGEPPIGSEGAEIGRWILLDLDDVVVHVFQPEARQHYALERLWGEAEPVLVPRVVGDVA
jgi:ribosome-associated protein